MPKADTPHVAWKKSRDSLYITFTDVKGISRQKWSHVIKKDSDGTILSEQERQNLANSKAAELEKYYSDHHHAA